MPKNTELNSIEDSAKRLGVTSKTINNWIQEGSIKFTKMIPVSEIERIEEENFLHDEDWMSLQNWAHAVHEKYMTAYMWAMNEKIRTKIRKNKIYVHRTQMKPDVKRGRPRKEEK